MKITAENEGKQRFRRERFNREGAMARGDAKRDFFTAENERKQRFRRVRLNREDAMARGYAKRDFFTAENEREQRSRREMLNRKKERRALRAYAETFTISSAALRVLWTGIF